MEFQRSFFLFFILFFIMGKPLTAVATPPDQSNATTDFIRTSCAATRYPDVCFESLSGYAVVVGKNRGQLARLAVALSLTKARQLASHLSNLTAAAASQEASATSPSPSPVAFSPSDAALASSAAAPQPSTTLAYNEHGKKSSDAALKDCLSLARDAADEMKDSLKQMRQAAATAETGGMQMFRFMMSNVQTWMSAALTDEDTCTDGFEEVPSGPIKSEVSDWVAEAEKYTSNALALVNDYVDSVAAR